MSINYRFVPAIAEQALNTLFRGKETLKGKSLTWWHSASPFTVNSALLSAYYLYMRTGDEFKDFRKRISFPSDSKLIIDSGGWELFTQQNTTDKGHLYVIKNLNQQKVLEIQEANADIGFVLDKPPYSITRNPNGTMNFIFDDSSFFKDALKFTRANTEYAVSHRNPLSKLKIYGVLQGFDWQQLTEWYNTMKKYPVDGWAVAPKLFGNMDKVAMYIAFILENNINAPIHFLGIGSFNSYALIIYLLRNDEYGKTYYSSLITSDSTNHDNGAKRRIYILPGNFKSKITIGRIDDIIDTDNMGNIIITGKKNNNTIPLNHLPCECPVCQLSSPEEMRAPTNSGSIAVSLHNLYQQKLLVTVLTSLISHPETYKDYVLSYNNPTVRHALTEYFDLIDNIIRYKRGYTNIKHSWISEHTDTSMEELLA